MWRILVIQALTRIPAWMVLGALGNPYAIGLSGGIQWILLLIYWWLRRPLLPRTWLILHFVIGFLCSIALLYTIPSGLYALFALGVYLIQGRTDRDRVPLYFSSQDVMSTLSALLAEERGVFFDLGCGDGRILSYLSRRHPHWVFKGYELALLPWLMACWRCRNCANVQILRSNFWSAPMDEADVCYCFLSPEPMRLIGEQFRRVGWDSCKIPKNKL